MAARSRRAPPVCEHFGPKRPRWRLGALDFSEKVANSQPGAAKGAGIPGSRGPYETDRFHPYDVASASLWGACDSDFADREGPMRTLLLPFSARWHGPLSLEPHLQHSAAVMATGPSGQANQKLADMGAAEVFELAAQAAKALLGRIKAPVV